MRTSYDVTIIGAGLAGLQCARLLARQGVALHDSVQTRGNLLATLLKNPAVVVLDEATSSLDTESERAIEAAMAELLRGRSTLIIAHRLSTVRRADRVIALEHGRIIEQGTHDELLEENGLYARLYRAGEWTVARR